MAIWFNSNIQKFNIANKRDLKIWIKNILFQYHHIPGNINFIFLNDSELLEYNRKFLGHNTFTDIITFDYSEREKEISGDIYISIERVKENSGSYYVSFNEELKRVIIHGILHLVGLNDKTKLEKAAMREVEDAALKIVKDLLIVKD